MPRWMVPDRKRSHNENLLTINKIIYYNKSRSYLYLKYIKIFQNHIKNSRTFNNTKENSYWLIQSTSRMQAERKHKNK